MKNRLSCEVGARRQATGQIPPHCVDVVASSHGVCPPRLRRLVFISPNSGEFGYFFIVVLAIPSNGNLSHSRDRLWRTQPFADRS